MLAEQLKEHTDQIHKQAEKKMIVQLQRIRSNGDYARMLNWMYGFYQPMEDRIAQYLTPTVFPDMGKRKRAANILRDIQDMGQPLPPPDICRGLPRIDSIPRALGALYVLEGSTLGGRVIATMLSRRLDNSGKGFSFFSAYGMENGSMWLAFKTFLERPYTAAEQEEIMTAAKETFTKFKNWIDQHELQPQL